MSGAAAIREKMSVPGTPRQRVMKPRYYLKTIIISRIVTAPKSSFILILKRVNMCFR